ncbi:hypothetical protein BGZ96_002044 [Linnemannia gamsii]|uniref:Uncharacterized protein n=1 Tax=Linnemannia gamsii TaxID=64522 RepID=A0ABQ7K8G7_9FUNG|nr:hypothetical protein BGZ96_002044 [Linnemannia gamsii]
MKFTLPIFVATLATSAQAVKLSYEAFSFTNVAGTFYKYNMIIDNKNIAETHLNGGSSAWVPFGPHKIQLKNAYMTGFQLCMDIFGDFHCYSFVAGDPTCSINPNSGWPECSTKWSDNNWLA